MSSPRYTGINHLAMVTPDMEATIRFWRDLLEMPLVAGMGRKGFRHYFFQITPNDQITFFEWDGVEPLPERDHGAPMRGPVAFDHLSLGVEDDRDLWLMKGRLETAGFWTSEVVDHGFIHSLYSFDPNGIPIEFSCKVPGEEIEKRPRLTDRSATALARRGPWPDPALRPADPPPPPKAERRLYPGEGEAFVHEENLWIDVGD